MKTKAIFAAIAVTALLAGCGQKGSESDSAAAGLAEEVAAGERLFSQYCSTCHQRKGRGNYLDKIPLTLLTRKSEKELMAWIRGSDMHREMPNFRQLTDEERRQLASYLHAEIRK